MTKRFCAQEHTTRGLHCAYCPHGQLLADDIRLKRINCHPPNKPVYRQSGGTIVAETDPRIHPRQDHGRHTWAQGEVLRIINSQN